MSQSSKDGSAQAPVPEQPPLGDFSKLPVELRHMIIDSTWDPNHPIKVYLRLSQTGPGQFECRWTPSARGNPGWTWQGEGLNAAFGPTVGFVCKEFYEQVAWRLKHERKALTVHVVDDLRHGSGLEPGRAAVPRARLPSLSYVKFDDWLTAAMTFTNVVISPPMLLECVEVPLRAGLVITPINIKTVDYLMKDLPTKELRLCYSRDSPTVDEDLEWTRDSARALFRIRPSHIKLTMIDEDKPESLEVLYDPLNLPGLSDP